MKVPHKVSQLEVKEACTEFLSPKGYRVTLVLNSSSDIPRKELLMASKISGFQDSQIVGDRITFVVKVQGKQDFETKSITEAVAYYCTY